MVTAGTSYNEFRGLQAMTDFLNRHHDDMIAAPRAKEYITKYIMPALMEAGVCHYDPQTKQFRKCGYREAELKILQKVRDRKKFLRSTITPPRPCHTEGVRTRSSRSSNTP